MGRVVILLVCCLCEHVSLEPRSGQHAGTSSGVPWASLLGRPLMLRGGKNIEFESLPRLFGPHRRTVRPAQMRAPSCAPASSHVQSCHAIYSLAQVFMVCGLTNSLNWFFHGWCVPAPR